MFETLIVQPLLNVLFLFYSVIPGHDFGIAIILLTVFVRLVLWPLAQKQLHSQKALTKIQPEVNKLKEKHKDDPQKFNAAVMELYKEKEVNPFSSCLPTLLQFPFLIGLFYVFIKFKDPNFVKVMADASSGIVAEIYPFIRNLGAVKEFIAETKVLDTTMFGILDLAKPNIVLGVLAGLTQFVQSKMMMPKKEDNQAEAAAFSGMTYFFPILTVGISVTLPAALPLYWTITTVFMVLQQYLVMHRDVDGLEKKSERKSNK